MIQPSNHIIVVFRNDDISALSDAVHEQRVLEIFEQYKIPQTIGVIPSYTVNSEQDPRGDSSIPLGENLKIIDFIRKCMDRSGSEIALHGYRHQTNQFSRPWRREYFEFRGLTLEEQEKRIYGGTEIIFETLSIHSQTFIPPWNRFDLNTLLACKKNGYKIVSAGVFTPILDGLVSFGANCNIENFPSILRQVEGSRNRVFLCVNYHSGKIRRQREFESLKKDVSLAAKTPGCEVVTISEAVSRFPNEIKSLNEAGKNIASEETVFDPGRGRALAYRKFFSFLPLAKDLNLLHRTAEKSYYQGKYDEVCGLSSSIDEKCKNLIWGSRGIVSLLGLFFSILCFLFISRMIPVNQTISSVMTLLILAMCWAGIWWYATSPDTRREIRLAGVLSLLSGGIGMILYYCLRHLFY